MSALNEGINSELFQVIVKVMDQTPVYKLFKIKLSKIGLGNCELTMLAGQQLSNPQLIVQGGILVSLADAAMGIAVKSLGVFGSTVEMSTQFLFPATTGQLLVARAFVAQEKNDLMFTRAEIAREHRILLRCQGTFFINGVIDLHN